jgi:antitoxin PrlF
MNTTLTLSSKGQVAIPKEYRERLGLSKGTRLKISLSPDGSLIMRPVKRKIDDLFGCLGSSKEGTMTVEDMDIAIEDLMKEHFP